MTDQERHARRVERLIRWAQAHGERAVFNPTDLNVWTTTEAWMAIGGFALFRKVCISDLFRETLKYCGNPWRER